MRINRKSALGLGIILTVVAVIGPCRFSYFQVCPICGEVQCVSERQLPLTSITYWTTRSLAQTPLSRVVRDDGLVGPHGHPWLFVQGSGNGVKCALGAGGQVWSMTAQSDWLARFIHCLARFKSKQEAERFLRLALDEKTSDDLRTALGMADFPDGFDDSRSFETWWAAHANELNQVGQK